MLLQVRDERRAEVAVRLLAAERRHVPAEQVERLRADPQRAPVARRVDEPGVGQRRDPGGDRGVHLARLHDLVDQQVAVRRPRLELEPGEDRLAREAVADRARQPQVGGAGEDPLLPRGQEQPRAALAITWSTVCRSWHAPPIANVSTAAIHSFSVVSSGPSGRCSSGAQPAEELVHVAEVAGDEEHEVDPPVVEVGQVHARAEDPPARRSADARRPRRGSRRGRCRDRAAPGRRPPRWSGASASPRRSGTRSLRISRYATRSRRSRYVPPRSATPVARKSSSRSSASAVGRSIAQQRCEPHRSEARTYAKNRPWAISRPSFSGRARSRSAATCSRDGTSPGKRSAAA